MIKLTDCVASKFRLIAASCLCAGLAFDLWVVLRYQTSFLICALITAPYVFSVLVWIGWYGAGKRSRGFVGFSAANFLILCVEMFSFWTTFVAPTSSTSSLVYAAKPFLQLATLVICVLTDILICGVVLKLRTYRE